MCPLGGVPVQAAAGTVIPHGGPRIGVRGGLLNIAQGDASVEGGRDECMPERVRPNRLADPGAASEPSDDPGGAVPVQLLLVSGGGPTADKPAEVFAPPRDPDQMSHAMTLRVTDCHAVYDALRLRGAVFLTPPHDWGSEIRCFLRDPDGHLVEISQSTST